jgi:1-acyl-sn-glycerol-3-phosphate acyltransferase
MKRILGKIFLQAMGWRVVGSAPDEPKYVLIAAPHTSNWDFPYMIAMAWSMRITVRWMGKDSLFQGIGGKFLRRMGGIAVERSKPHGMVEQLAEAFDEAESMVLVVPAEGTRKRVEFWKIGFYRIAQRAKVPIMLGWLDFGKRQGGIGPRVNATGNMQSDMDKIRAFYCNIQGKHPERFGAPRLREEQPITNPKHN